MKLILYSANYYPELTGIGKYNGEMAARFVESGVETHVIAAPPYYPEWQRHRAYRNAWSRTVDRNGVVVHRAPMYVPSKVSFLTRIFHLISFALSSVFQLIKLLFLKPNVLVVVQPSLFCAPAALVYCALTGAKSVMHIQDFELDAMIGLGMSGGAKRWAPVRYIERFIIQRFDFVSSISFYMLEKAKQKGVLAEKLVFFPNWADTSFVTPEVSGEALRENWGYKQNDKLVLYSGNLGNKQGLELILDAAIAFDNQPDVQFLIVGDGTNRENLQSQAHARNINNVRFFPLQPYEKLPELLAMADVHLVVQRRGVADSVLPSKLTNIFSCGGHALVTAEPQTELGRIHEQYPGIFELTEPENLDSFIESLRSMLDSNLKEVNLVAWKYALEHLSKNTVVDRFLREVNESDVSLRRGLAGEQNAK